MADRVEQSAQTNDEKTASGGVSRRVFLGGAAAASLVPLSGAAVTKAVDRASTFLDLLRVPTSVTAYARRDRPLTLDRSGDEWRGSGVEVETKIIDGEVRIAISAAAVELRYVHLRWQMPVATRLLTLGDAWERSYGDLGWRNLIPERVMPWYFATQDGHAMHAYGVKTGAATLCFWQLDAEGVSLWLNTSNGGAGVQLGQRRLPAATVVAREGHRQEDATQALRAFCAMMCSRKPLAFPTVYGTNDWYYAYGENTAQKTLEDAEFVAKLSGANAVQPFAVIDEGWEKGSPTFPDIAQLAKEIRERKVRPGIWIRPLRTKAGTNAGLLMPDARFGDKTERAKEMALDPTVPEAMAMAVAKVTQVRDWGFELIKHDFSTYDVLGQWGFEMGADPTLAGWALHDRTRTNAEVITDLYMHIREAAGSQNLVLGCNTIGHLSQGLFELSRTGDDTSGHIWERTRRMGVNTLAFRLPQHRSFFVQDADCVGITPAIAWEKNKQWLDLLAQSGTALFISPGEGARTSDHASAIRDAFQLVAAGGAEAVPTSCEQESAPQSWAATSAKLHYDWNSPEGAFPFTGDGN